NWGQVKKIVATDRGASDSFGFSVAISGGLVVVGANLEDEDALGGNTLSAAGSAYVFSQNQGGTDNWGQVKKIVATDRGASDSFGRSVGISGGLVVVGANQEDEDASGSNTLFNAGSVYVFSQNQGGADNWGQVKKIVATDRGASDNFGYSVAISGSLIVVGAYREDEDASGTNTVTDAGSAYVFSQNQGGADNWGQVKKVVATDRGTSDNFGYSVAISGSQLVVGAYADDEDASGGNTLTDAGSAYVFSQNQGGADNWGQTQKVVLGDYVGNQLYGSSVAIDGEYAVVGAPQDYLDANSGQVLLRAGSAYVLKRQNGIWTQIKKLVASDRASDDF
ncbi:FG-GAP repeat protein, partial [Spirosoma sp. 48-14]|uniref:FG-GAP repeat protein n=1 Tax=Spirosoma sp. 48-14 TaxID=1895854 RepID=UPI0025D81566